MRNDPSHRAVEHGPEAEARTTETTEHTIVPMLVVLIWRRVQWRTRWIAYRLIPLSSSLLSPHADGHHNDQYNHENKDDGKEEDNDVVEESELSYGSRRRR